MMQFELLANELLLDVFEYLDTAHLLRAFIKLNSRFNQLVYQHCRFHQFNLQFLSKEDFDDIFQDHFPILSEQIISLRLSNNETPDLPELLLSSGFTFHRFLCLQSLSLYDIHSLQTLDQIIYQCQILPHLTHLNIIKHTDAKVHLNISNLLNNIWSLSKLTYCNLNGIIHSDETSLSKISVISTSIEHLFIENIPCNLIGLSHLMKCTPSLRRFSTTLYSYSSMDHVKSIAVGMKEMRLCFGGSLSALRNLLENVRQLSRLTLITSQIYLDGNMWKKLLISYLPNLRIFHLKMELNFQQRYEEIEEIIDELLESFRTSFWIEEHQWYVRCHWNPSDPYKSVTLYTLPYAFETYNFFDRSSTKSTCLDEQQYWYYNRVHTFAQGFINNTSLSDDFSLSHARFSHIRQLQINLPFDDMFWLRFTPCHHLTSLHVSLYRSSAYRQLQTLFDQSPYLYSFKIESYINFSTQIFELMNKSIRRLDLFDILANQSMYFNREDCLTFTNSPLGMQCEVLLIYIKYRTIVLDLIERMNNLRLLIFECEGDKELSFLTFPSSKNELIQWLHDHLPSTCTITTDRRKRSRNQIWISRRERKSSPIDTSLVNRNNRLLQVFTSFRQLTFLKF